MARPGGRADVAAVSKITHQHDLGRCLLLHRHLRFGKPIILGNFCRCFAVLRHHWRRKKRCHRQDQAKQGRTCELNFHVLFPDPLWVDDQRCTKKPAPVNSALQVSPATFSKRAGLTPKKPRCHKGLNSIMAPAANRRRAKLSFRAASPDPKCANRVCQSHQAMGKPRGS